MTWRNSTFHNKTDQVKKYVEFHSDVTPIYLTTLIILVKFVVHFVLVIKYVTISNKETVRDST